MIMIFNRGFHKRFNQGGKQLRRVLGAPRIHSFLITPVVVIDGRGYEG
jgi:hypothetical protein